MNHMVALLGPHNPLGLAVMVLVLALAFFVWRGARQRTNRLAATILTMEALVVGGGAMYAFVQDGPVWLYMGTGALFVVMASCYPRLVSTLDTPWATPFRGTRGLVACVAFAVIVILANLIVGLNEYFGSEAPAFLSMVHLPAVAISITGLVLGLLGVAVYALIASISAYRRTTPGSPQRRRAYSWVVAFGTRDALWAVHVILAVSFAAIFGEYSWEAQQIWIWGPPIYLSFYAALLAYGILRSQLFDIDLKIKWGISRGTTVTILIIATLIVSKLAEFYLTREIGYVAGGVVAGLLLFVVPRLNKIGDKVAQKALPQVENTSQYVAFRKLEVYQAALQSAMESGGITPKERDTLGRLRVKLGISEQDAKQVEDELLPVLPTVPPFPAASQGL